MLMILINIKNESDRVASDELNTAAVWWLRVEYRVYYSTYSTVHYYSTVAQA